MNFSPLHQQKPAVVREPVPARQFESELEFPWWYRPQQQEEKVSNIPNTIPIGGTEIGGKRFW